ncbi:2OG-Fe(II) oxygenase [Salegentibacter sp. F188]|uniref:2OG-Fe(II) oxygenase n=1 Tax=Autumnicola patrickiae TaxID=3075591 RepID=A0ABU3E7T6_9FLAO|nr:2OG-Fe(II) oxygenase [Salegentibacter sp. F188]MDT0691317.1 2OG-Fe(II) oxygenase [Salegentibacter sp. F188]
MEAASEELYEQLEFRENPLYEKIISDLLENQYSVIDSFFDEDEVEALRNSLLNKYTEDNFKKAAIGNRTNEVIAKSVRGDFIMWINEAEAGDAEKLFFNKINALVDYLNKTCFLGILTKEFHYALYPEETFYKRHLDTFQNDGRRKLSMVCYLNQEDWRPENGGELVIYKDENGVETSKSIFPFPGRMVIFESQVLEHEVKPVKQERLSITGWLKTR